MTRAAGRAIAILGLTVASCGDAVPAAVSPAPCPDLPSRDRAHLSASAIAPTVKSIRQAFADASGGPGFRENGVQADGDSIRIRLSPADGGADVRVCLADPSIPCPDCLPAGAFQVRAEPGVPDGDRVARRVAEALSLTPAIPGTWNRPEVAGCDWTTGPGLRLPGPSAAVPVAMRMLWVLLLLWWFRDAWRRLRSGVEADDGFSLALFLSSTGLVLSLATFGPGDLQWNQAPFFLDPWGADTRYGSAPGGLLRLVFAFVPATPDSSIVVQALLAGLAPVLAFRLAEALGTGRVAAAIAGIAMASHPLAVRFAGEGDRQAWVVVLALEALLALSGSRRRGNGSPEPLRYAAAATLCVNSRPEALMLLIPAILLTASGLPVGRSGRRTGNRILWAAHAGILAVNLPRIASVLGRFSEVDTATMEPHGRSAVDAVWLNPDTSAVVAIALVLAGAAAAIVRRDRAASWASISLAIVTWFGAGFPTTPLKLASARYQALALPLAAVAAGCGARLLSELAVDSARTSRGRRRASVAAPLLLAGLLGASDLAPMGRVTAPRTVDAEFRFLLETLPTLPEEAEIFYTCPSERMNVDLGFRAPVELSRVLGLPRQRWRPWRDEGAPPAGSPPRFFLLQATCAATHLDLDAPGRAAVREAFGRRCRRAMDRFGGDPFAVRDVPAVRFGSEVYGSDPVPIGFFRMR